MDKIVKKNIDYDQIVEETLRLVVKKSLELVNEEGLPGDHHFYISFDSTHEGVKVPSELKAGEDNEIKIILQHQFWDLIIDDHKFSVVLSFSGKKKNISVPFNSITSFSDPSVGFSLQFKKDFQAENISKEKKISSNKSNEDKKQKFNAEIFSLDAFRSKKEETNQATVNIAPTIAKYLGVQIPSYCDGSPIDFWYVTDSRTH